MHHDRALSGGCGSRIEGAGNGTPGPTTNREGHHSAERAGLEIPEISRRVGKKPGTVIRILRMIDLRAGSPMSQDRWRRQRFGPWSEW